MASPLSLRRAQLKEIDHSLEQAEGHLIETYEKEIEESREEAQKALVQGSGEPSPRRAGEEVSPIDRNQSVGTEDDGIIDVASDARMSGEPETTAADSGRLRSSASHKSDQRAKEWVYRPRKHGMCYVSTYKSQPSHGFGRARRPCCEQEPKKKKPPQQVPLEPPTPKARRSPSTPARAHSSAQRRASDFSEEASQASLPRRPSTRASFREPSRGSIGDGGGGGDVDVRGMTAEGGRPPAVRFAGRTTFGTARQRPVFTSDGPGPAGARAEYRRRVSGGRFSSKKSLSELDKQIRAARDRPGPASYSTEIEGRVSGGRFNMSKPMTELDLISRRARLLPGPADYSTNQPWGFTMNSKVPGGHPLPNGGRVMFPQHGSGYGRHGGMGQWVIRQLAEDALYATPGPGYYHTDF